MSSIQNLSQSDQRAFTQHLEDLQVKDSLLMYNRLVHKCFKECVNGFKSKQLDKGEVACVENCAGEFRCVVVGCGVIAFGNCGTTRGTGRPETNTPMYGHTQASTSRARNELGSASPSTKRCSRPHKGEGSLRFWNNNKR